MGRGAGGGGGVVKGRGMLVEREVRAKEFVRVDDFGAARRGRVVRG